MLNRPFFLLYIILITFNAHAQQYNFRNFSSEHGLPETSVSSIREDKRGNLWIATEGGGIFQFDGYTFQRYLQEDGLISNSVHDIYEDQTGKLWIATEEGVSTFDGINFRTFSPLGKSKVNNILQDATGRFWFATSQGLMQYDRGVLTQFTTKEGLPDNNIQCVYKDKNDNLWIGTTKGVAKYNQRSFRFYSVNDGLPSNNIRGMVEDRVGRMWFATANGLSQLDNGTFTTYTTKNGLRSNDLHALSFDGKGNLWIGTSGGISKYDGNVFHYYDSHTGQGANMITCVYHDTSGNLWFGSAQRGISKLDSERFIHYPENDQMGKRVYALIQAINGNLICGTSLGGTTVFDGKNYALLDGIEGFTSSIVQAFYYTPDSTLWVGTQDEGAFKFSQSRFQKYTRDEGLVSNNITGFAMDPTGNMWLASGDSGVTVVHASPGDSLRIVQRFNITNGLASNRISTITADRSGNMWIGTEDNGIDKVTLPPDSAAGALIVHFGVQHGLSSHVIHTIMIDSSDHIFIGTSKGISIYNDNRFINIGKEQGLGSNNVYALTQDRNENLWAGTERGVDMIAFSGDTYAIRHFGNDEGFKGVEVYRNSSCTDRDGNVWFGTVNGLVKYNPREEVEMNITPRIYITGIKLFFDKIEDTRYADSVSAWYAIPTELTLPHHQNNLTFSFSGIYHRHPQAVRYRWMLEGFNDEWSPSMANREATFSNLPAGTYTFKVIAGNEYDKWTAIPATFTFTIQAPWWELWWVRTLGLLAIISFIWMIFYVHIQRIKARNRAIQEKLEMENNILQLEQEAARLQMNPHFIFNSLNSIQGFIATNDPFQAKKYLAKFAKLMRLILENAREEFIPLQNEINMLENYLELERLSSNYKFDFSITIEQSIDPESVQIPPMMIQPFVENAIIHGVKKKEGKGLITINFRIEQNLIICEIKDDGIGRKKSQHINGLTRANHQSTGISVTTRRLEQYGEHRNVNAGVQIVDLEDGGASLGTKVIIATPFE